MTPSRNTWNFPHTPADWLLWNAGIARARADYHQRVYGLRCRHCSLFVSAARPVCARCEGRRARGRV